MSFGSLQDSATQLGSRIRVLQPSMRRSLAIDGRWGLQGIMQGSLVQAEEYAMLGFRLCQ